MEDVFDLNGSSVLITGGTGTLGKALTGCILMRWPEIRSLVIFSRDEQKQFQMAQEYPSNLYPAIRYVIGDVRDYKRLKSALEGIDYVIHAAAMKHVHIAELNPEECVKTNIGGAQNMVRAASEASVKRVVALSTDKACAPTGLYGATKLVSDKLFVSSGPCKEGERIRFSVVRLGNILNSAGSVVSCFLEKRKSGVLPVTSGEMTRFHISPEAGAEMVLLALERAWGGEIFVPKLSSYHLMDMARAIGPGCEYRITGIRPGEKIHEDMISVSDSLFTYDLGEYYVIIPPVPTWNLDDFIKEQGAKRVPEGFTYASGNNSRWETSATLRKLIEGRGCDLSG